MVATAIDLDSAATYRQLDPFRMGRRIADLPLQCLRAWHQAQDFEIPEDWKRTTQVVWGGMGGSAIAGDLAQDFSAAQQGISVRVVRGFQPPFKLEKEHLFIACSYSGKTEETISLYRQAAASPTAILVISTGGELAALARETRCSFLRVPSAGEPRSSAGYFLLLVLGLLGRLGLLTISTRDVEAAVENLKVAAAKLSEAVPVANNLAKQTANDLAGRIPVVYGSGIFTGLARRWKTQFNENAKTWAFHEEIPELLHNSVEAFQISPMAAALFPLILQPQNSSAQVSRRYEILFHLLEKQGIEHRQFASTQKDLLGQLLEMMLLGDYVSYYSAILQGIDPSATPLLDLGKRLAGKGETPFRPQL